MEKKLGLYGPFENPQDIEDSWYQFAEEELVEGIESIKSEIEEEILFSYATRYTERVALIWAGTANVSQPPDMWFPIIAFII